MVLPSSCGSFRTGALPDAFLGHLSEANPMDLTVCWLKLQPAAVEVEGARIVARSFASRPSGCDCVYCIERARACARRCGELERGHKERPPAGRVNALRCRSRQVDPPGSNPGWPVRASAGASTKAAWSDHAGGWLAGQSSKLAGCAGARKTSVLRHRAAARRWKAGVSISFDR